MRLALCLLMLGCLCPLACGGSQKPADDAASESSDSKSEGETAEASEEKVDSASDSKPEADASAKDESASEAKSGKDDKKEAAADSSSGPVVKRTPKDLLTAPDVIFMFAFNASDMKKEAEERCDKKAKDDPKKRAQCMTKEKEKIEADGIRFKQEKGNWYWMIVRRKGKTLVNLHKIPIEFDKETDTSVVLKPIGKDEGTERGKGPGATKVNVPNEYQIEIDDPEHGKMVYEAKLGLTEPAQR